MQQGKFIVIDGLPGSGKRTNSRKLIERIAADGILGKLISFPNYRSDSSALIQRYLKGHFTNIYGEEGLMTHIKQMSMFYTVDRIASLVKKDLSLQLSIVELIEKGFTIICDRYTTSNMLHMSSYFNNPNDVKNYIDWVEDFEYHEIGLPRPDLVIFLDVSYETSLKNITKKINNNERYRDRDDDRPERIDIHKNLEHLERVFDVKDEVVKYCNWKPIQCCNENGEMLPLEIVSNMIYDEVKKVMRW